MHHCSRIAWRAHQGRVVVLTLGLTVVTYSLLRWAQDAGPGHTASEGAATFEFTELPVTATKTPRDPLTTPGEGNVISREETVYDLYAFRRPRLGLLKGLRVDFGIDNLTDRQYRRHLASLPEAGLNPKASISYTRSW
jgi:outer membrane receptor protein involved in Fe transport